MFVSYDRCSINFNVFDEDASQKAVFDNAALPLIEDLLKGKNGKAKKNVFRLTLEKKIGWIGREFFFFFFFFFTLFMKNN